MSIIALFRYIFSYVEFVAEKGFFERFLNLCAREGVKIYSPEIKNGKLSGSMSARDWKNILPIVRRAHTPLKLTAKHGLYFTLKKRKDRVGMPIGAAIFLILMFVLSGRVWNINIVGDAKLPREQIVSVLEQSGLYEGCLKSGLQTQAAKHIRDELLNKVSELSWASINLNGCIADVECRMKAKVPNAQDYTICNIIASKSGRISEIKAYRGTPCVKVGDAVESGQLLVSGAVEMTNGGTLFCAADAEVYAEVEEKLSVFVPFEQKSKIPSSKPVKRTVVTVFGFNIPLFLGSVGGENEVQRESFVPEFDGVRLPFKIVTADFYPLTEISRRITVEDARKLAVTQLDEQKTQRFKDSVLSGKNPEFSQSDNGVNAVCGFVCKENIAKSEKILINS